MKSIESIARLLEHTLSVPDNKTIAPDYAVGRIASRTMEIGVWRMRIPEGDFVFSPPALDLLGLPHDSGPIPADKLLMRFTKEGRVRSAQLIKGALEEHRGFQVEAQVIDFQNRSRFLEYFGDVEFDATGNISGLVGTLRDVTGQRQAEQLATTRLLMLKSLFKHVPLAIAMFNTSMRYVAVSDYWIAGHDLTSAADVLGKCHYDLFDLPEEVKREHRQVLAGVTLKRPRAYIKDKNGNPIPQSATLTPWYERYGEVGGMMIILSEIDLDNQIDPTLAISDKPTKGEFDDLISKLASVA